MGMNIRKICVLGMLSTIAFILAAYARVPVVLFLRYDPKDIVITIGGFLYGPMAALIISVVVSAVQMFTVSATGFWGLLMNIAGSVSFCCTAAFIYQRNRSLKGAVLGLVTAAIAAAAVMMAWNYLIAPIYMGQTRQQIAALLIPAFLPFNLLKGFLNAALTMILYKPVKAALQSARLMPPPAEPVKTRINAGVIIASVFIAATCVLWIMMLRGILFG